MDSALAEAGTTQGGGGSLLRAVTYDDTENDGNGGSGFAGSGDIEFLWVQAFQVQPTGESLTSITVRITRQGTANEPFDFIIYADPTQDGDMRDAIPIATIPSNSPAAFNFVSHSFPTPLNVGRPGNWFGIGVAKFVNPGAVLDQGYPARIDTLGVPSGNAWAFWPCCDFLPVLRYPLSGNAGVVRQTSYDFVNRGVGDTPVSILPDYAAAITRAATQADTTSVLPATFDLAFGAAIEDRTLVPADITFSGTSTVTDFDLTGSGTSWQITVNAATPGTITPEIAAEASWNALDVISRNLDGTTESVTLLAPPTALCQNVTIQLDGSGSATLAASAVDNGSFGDLTIASVSVSPDTFDCSNLGANTVTLTVTDADGATGTCEATVTVEDNIDPTFTQCPPAILPPGRVLVANSASGFDPSLDSAWNDPASFGTDNCGAGLDVSYTPSVFGPGCTTVTVTLTDDGGNTAECTFEVVIGSDDGGTAYMDSSFLQDGNLYEAPGAPGTGGTVLIANRRAQVGDDARDLELRSVLGFTTVLGCRGITDARLRLPIETKVGDVSNLGDLVVELAVPFFGPTAGWQAEDFEAAADFTPVATIPNATVAAALPGEAIVALLDPAAWSLIPTTGNAQFRLRFTNPTDGNAAADFVTFGAGGVTNSNRFRRTDLVLSTLLPTDLGCGDNPAGSSASEPLDPIYSTPNNDGFVVEYTAGAGVGNLVDATNQIIELGDSALDQQVKALLSFDTSVMNAYPGAEIVSASICVTLERPLGDPSTLGRVYVEMLCPNLAMNFGTSPGLEMEDFESHAYIADATAAVPVLPAAAGETVCWPLSAEALAAIQRTGSTQFRLRFEQGDNGNQAKDALRLFSGNASGMVRARLELEVAP
ncbi:MAG: hypothetical protein SF028_07150 [Candidatus Sumerlaeia bacterium]|nr:hypothetical protein [Candidatus Sumerlaeia bacterium]